MRIFLIATITACLLVSAAPVSAQSLSAGQQAFESGDYAAALREWQPLAE